ncbi:MAG: secondary thiamine-phosphate synthase enzyme YjbQ [Methylohalobius sp.]|nr:secondary thiamine-phosphate synthase enzyme YjbQ [Methylohalobius sp.]
MANYYLRLVVQTRANFEVIDLTERVQSCITSSGIAEGIAVVSSLHTTVAVVVNENEPRLLEDIREQFLRLLPPDGNYRHNDLHLRDCPPDEPENAHAHLIAMMLGNSVTLSVHLGRLDLGDWQALLMIELDGPRLRQVAVQVLG